MASSSYFGGLKNDDLGGRSWNKMRALSRTRRLLTISSSPSRSSREFLLLACQKSSNSSFDFYKPNLYKNNDISP